MGKIRYTITTITKKCPHCEKIIDKETHGSFTPFYGIAILLTFPVSIPYFLIRYLALRNPTFPKIGPKFTPCPYCSLPIRTNNDALEDLNGEELFLHKFKKWVYISYVIGSVLGFCGFSILFGEPIVSWYGLLSILSLIGVVLIVITYHIKLEQITNPTANILDQSKTIDHSDKSPALNDNTSFFYCRKCGTKLPSDSRFCQKCGAEIIKIPNFHC